MKLPKTTRPLVYLYLYMHCVLFFIAYSFSPIQRAPAKICLDHRIWGLKLLGQEDGSFGSGPRSFAGFAYAGVGMFQFSKIWQPLCTTEPKKACMHLCSLKITLYLHPTRPVKRGLQIPKKDCHDCLGGGFKYVLFSSLPILFKRVETTN